jgi:predicted RNase H-related nuclease YkuK (DUF458 family)
MLNDNIIRDLSGNHYNYNDFLQQLKFYEKNQFNLFIGTDSKITKDNIILATVICFHKANTSGRVFYIKEKVSKKKYSNLRTRMLLEAFKSVELATEISSIFRNQLEIHLDVGDTIRSKTATFEPEIRNMVIAQGYDCKIKPESWSSSAVADKILRKV